MYVFIHNNCYKVTRRTSLFRAVALISLLYVFKTLPGNLPDVVGLDIVSGQAEVGDGVDQHDVLTEQPLHEAVQQAPAELPTGRYGPNLDIS